MTVHSPTGLDESQLKESGVWDAHDADIPSNDGFVLTPEEENNLRKSISRRRSKALSRRNTLESDVIPKPNKEADLEDGIANGASSDDATVDIPTEDDPNVVWWDGDDDPANPRNWSPLIQWSNIVLISLITLLTPLASSMCAPAVPFISEEFKITSTDLQSFIVSCYVLGFALGPLVIAPLSEVYGRVPIYHICNVCFVAFNIGCAKSKNTGMLIAFRFLAGCAGSCPLTNGGGSIHDLIPAEKRGKVAGVFGLGPLLGPIIGPIGGGFLAENKGWRWVFWLITIVSGAFTILCFLCMRETFAPVILERKAKRLRKETGNLELRSKLDNGMTQWEMVRHAISRPLKILFLSPIVIAFSVYVAVIYGYLYLLFTTITPMYINNYHWNIGTTGLAYLGLGIGSMMGLFVFSYFSDKIVQQRAILGHTAIKPEYRLPPLIYGAIALPIGFFWYGWSADARAHWVVPILGEIWIGIGILLCFMCTLTYIIDSFAAYAASALAANTVLRSLVGAVLPLAGPKMYSALGLGWGNSLLGFIAIAFIPVPLLFSRYGEFLRTKYEIKNL